MSICHSSKKRCSSKKKKSSEYYHQIELIDDISSVVSDKPRGITSKKKATDQSNQLPRKKCSFDLYPHQSPFRLREGSAHRKFAKYQDVDSLKSKDNSPFSSFGKKTRKKSSKRQEENEGTIRTEVKKSSVLNRFSEEAKYAVDVLFENQRGLFCCGIPLFSSRALGNLDPAPWTNIAQKTSATDITNAQPPDPSWEWIGDKWSVYHADEPGECWKYSFAFNGRFSWHRGRWWNSFVRRRAWVRKRVKKKLEYDENESYMFSSHNSLAYHTGSRYNNQLSSLKGKNSSSYDLFIGKRSTDVEKIKNIHDISTLKKAFRSVRIDREITEFVQNFIKNGSDDLFNLKDQMHEIMHLFIFQASRHSLVALLRESLNQALNQREKCINSHHKDERDKVEALNFALSAAEDEIRNFGF
ncbi:Meiotically up-regulated gene 65 protein [Golovinomyces cichoracearum]|uniref:Meiotically up-regulated gene 65 protein n=1 Tax=Golovinomyces cichoracearum TaxID=62708 RepID=A0A420J2N9_9PEZI|nr:Meiotically up-regulated gene 65 protein [Golovinomyces cichoracearum]